MAGTYTFQPSFAAGVLGPGLQGRIDLAKYQVGLKTGENIFIHAHGGFSNRAGTRLVAEVPDSTKFHRLIPFERDDTQTYALLFGDNTMNVIQNGAVLGAPYVLATPYASTQIAALSYVQSIDVMYLAHPSFTPRKMLHSGPLAWAMASVATNPPNPAPGTPTVTSANIGDGKTYSYRVSSVVDGVESLPSAEGSVTNARDLNKDGEQNTITWTAPAGPTPDEYRVYRLRGGVWGYVGFTDGVTLTLLDDNIDPDTNTSIRQPNTLFASDGNYPSVVTLAQQRLIWAASDNQPETVWASLIGDYENYTRAMVMKADDRFIIDISGEKLNRVRGMVGMQELMVFTGSGEYGVGAANGVLSATEPRQQRYGASGSSGVRPLMVGDSILYVDRSGRLVRDLRYTYELDGYAGNDLTVFVPHFFLGKQVVDWAYCHAPYGLVWVVLSDGSVVSLTYKREQEVWAWTIHDFGGVVESCCSVSEDTYDALYLVVRRGDKRFVERMSNRLLVEDVMETCFLDCAVSYNGVSTMTMTGLDHLEGQKINIVADGDVYEDRLVTGGQVVLPVAFTRAHAGLPYVSEGETLPIAVELQGTGNSRGLPAKATDAFVQLEKTRGIEVQTSMNTLPAQMVQTGFEDLSDDIPLFTGLQKFELGPEWDATATITVRQKFPLPMTVLGISPKWSIGR